VLEGVFEEIKRRAESFKFSSNHVERIQLFKSEQIQFKRIYTKISEYPLG